MSKVQRFEDLKCWQAARSLVKEVYQVCEEGKLAKDYETKGQLKKAALTTMNKHSRRLWTFQPQRFYPFSGHITEFSIRSTKHALCF